MQAWPQPVVLFLSTEQVSVAGELPECTFHMFAQVITYVYLPKKIHEAEFAQKKMMKLKGSEGTHIQWETIESLALNLGV